MTPSRCERTSEGCVRQGERRNQFVVDDAGTVPGNSAVEPNAPLGQSSLHPIPLAPFLFLLLPVLFLHLAAATRAPHVLCAQARDIRF